MCDYFRGGSNYLSPDVIGEGLGNSPGGYFVSATGLGIYTNESIYTGSDLICSNVVCHNLSVALDGYASTGFVPYHDATQDVNLGNHTLILYGSGHLDSFLFPDLSFLSLFSGIFQSSNWR